LIAVTKKCIKIQFVFVLINAHLTPNFRKTQKNLINTKENSITAEKFRKTKENSENADNSSSFKKIQT
jgi:hypothetical protein